MDKYIEIDKINSNKDDTGIAKRTTKKKEKQKIDKLFIVEVQCKVFSVLQGKHNYILYFYISTSLFIQLKSYYYPILKWDIAFSVYRQGYILLRIHIYNYLQTR